MLQIVFQMLFIFMILWMTVFHNRWQNFRDFITKNYSEDSLNYLCGFFIFLALIGITFGRGWIFFEISLYRETDKQSLTVQNSLICLLMNSKKTSTSHNTMKHFRDIGQKLFELSEFYFTVLPTSECSLLQENQRRTSIFRVILIFITHLISSIPERQKFFSFLKFKN